MKKQPKYFTKQAKLPKGAYAKTLDEATASYRRINWSALKLNHCPQCEGDFTIDLSTRPTYNGRDKLLTHICGFSIRESKYRGIIANQTMVHIGRNTNNED